LERKNESEERLKAADRNWRRSSTLPIMEKEHGVLGAAKKAPGTPCSLLTEIICKYRSIP
jgi:hypothetical protein